MNVEKASNIVAKSNRKFIQKKNNKTNIKTKHGYKLQVTYCLINQSLSFFNIFTVKLSFAKF